MDQKTTEYSDLFNRLTQSTLVVIVTIGLGMMIWVAYLFRSYDGLVTITSFDQAQVARNLHFGNGFTTGIITPLALSLREEALFPPDLQNSPAYIHFLAWFFNRFGVSDEVVLASSLFLSLLAGIGIFILAWLMTKNLIWSAMVFLVFAAALGTLEFAFNPSSAAMLSLLLVIFAGLYYFYDRRSLHQVMLLGAGAGLLYLAEFDFLLLSVPIGILVARSFEGKKLRAALVFAGGFILLSSPWLIRNTIVAGNPVYSFRWADFVIHSRAFPGNRFLRDYGAAFSGAPFPHLSWSKFTGLIRLMNRYWLSYSHLLIMPLFLVSLFLNLGNRRWERANRLILCLFFFQLILIAFGNGRLDRLLAFTPLIALSGMTAFKELLEDYFPRQVIIRWTCIGVFVLAGVYPGFMAIARGLPDQRYLSTIFAGEDIELMRRAERLAELRSTVRENEAIVSDIPWPVAWYAHRTVLWFPWEVEQLKEIKEKFEEIKFIYLSPIVFEYPEIENVADWASIYRSGMVPEWLPIDRGVLLPGDDVLLGDLILERLDLE